MTTINVGGRELALILTLDALDAIERRFDKPMATNAEGLTGMLGERRSLVALLCILACQGEYMNGRDPDFDETWLARHLSPGRLPAVQNAVLSAILEGMRMEGGQDDDGDVDAVLEVTGKLLELPLDEPSPETRNSKGRYACIYKGYVLCSDHTKCDKCGWAPEVERRRIAESREALK